MINKETLQFFPKVMSHSYLAAHSLTLCAHSHAHECNPPHTNKTEGFSFDLTQHFCAVLHICLSLG